MFALAAVERLVELFDLAAFSLRHRNLQYILVGHIMSVWCHWGNLPVQQCLFPLSDCSPRLTVKTACEQLPYYLTFSALPPPPLQWIGRVYLTVQIQPSVTGLGSPCWKFPCAQETWNYQNY